MIPRRRAREVALQSLYELDCTQHKAEEVLARRVYDDSIDEQALAFITAIVEGVRAHQRQLDSIIRQYAPAFPVEQMAPIDRTILRIGLYELVFAREVPVKVSVNEAVELAKRYGGDATPRLVNGVLGAVAAKEATAAPLNQTQI